MRRYLADLAVVVDAFDDEDAKRISEEIRRLLNRHRLTHRIAAVRVCHVEKTETEDAA